MQGPFAVSVHGHNAGVPRRGEREGDAVRRVDSPGMGQFRVEKLNGGRCGAECSTADGDVKTAPGTRRSRKPKSSACARASFAALSRWGFFTKKVHRRSVLSRRLASVCKHFDANRGV